MSGTCLNCGHPTSHHDAGECWTNGNGTESVDTTCGCGWWEPAPGHEIADDYEGNDHE